MFQHYHHTQFGTVLVALIGLGFLGAMAASLAVHQFTLAAMFLLILLITLALSGWMTIEVGEGVLRWRMGIGLMGGSCALAEIAEVSLVRNPWWYGLGVHLTPDGWLYNVSGSQAVRIQLTSGRAVRLGTDEPQMLLDALDPDTQRRDRAGR